MKVLLKLVCYTCGLTTLETRYSYFSYMHFILICTVVVLYCFVVCVWQIEVRECLLSFGAESVVFQVAIQKLKDQDI